MIGSFQTEDEAIFAVKKVAEAILHGRVSVEIGQNTIFLKREDQLAQTYGGVSSVASDSSSNFPKKISTNVDELSNCAIISDAAETPDASLIDSHQAIS